MASNLAMPLVLLALTLTGCTGGDDDVSAPAARTAPIGGATGSELAEIQVLRRGNGSEPQSLDPHGATGSSSSNIQRDLFEGLVSEAANGDLTPGAAASWDISDDGVVYTFHLRPDTGWSNGNPVTADDWVYSLRRSVDPVTLSQYTFAGEVPAYGWVPPINGYVSQRMPEAAWTQEERNVEA